VSRRSIYAPSRVLHPADSQGRYIGEKVAVSEAADLEKTINDSGFPLQLGLKQLVKSRGGWQVLQTAGSWPIHDFVKVKSLNTWRRNALGSLTRCVR
jgi:hypothetical protein